MQRQEMLKDLRKIAREAVESFPDDRDQQCQHAMTQTTAHKKFWEWSQDLWQTAVRGIVSDERHKIEMSQHETTEQAMT